MHEGFFPAEDKELWLEAINILVEINVRVREDLRDTILLGKEQTMLNEANNNGTGAVVTNQSAAKEDERNSRRKDSSTSNKKLSRRNSKIRKMSTSGIKGPQQRSQKKKKSSASNVYIPESLDGLRPPLVWNFPIERIEEIVKRISGPKNCAIVIVDQDQILNNNQKRSVRCGDNGIFKGVPVSEEEKSLTRIVKDLYSKIPYDGKYILDSKGPRLVACQSHVKSKEFEKILPNAVVNPLGDWIGGTAVDSGATNRKLGSDMGRAITGGGLHGKDLSKADVSINIYAHLKAQETLEPVEISCAIGDEFVDGKPYSEIVEIARNYIKEVGGFEKFAEWGLIR